MELFEAGVTMVDDGSEFGLYIVTRIPEAHRWKVEMTERESGGARIEITDIVGLLAAK